MRGWMLECTANGGDSGINLAARRFHKPSICFKNPIKAFVVPFEQSLLALSALRRGEGTSRPS